MTHAVQIIKGLLFSVAAICYLSAIWIVDLTLPAGMASDGSATFAKVALASWPFMIGTVALVGAGVILTAQWAVLRIEAAIVWRNHQARW